LKINFVKFWANYGGVGKNHVFLPVARHILQMVQDMITVISWLITYYFSLC